MALQSGAGKVVYLTPQHIHLVFSLPEGRQTLALASHVIRQSEVPDWCSVLDLQARLSPGP
jgi:hypothetical protein